MLLKPCHPESPWNLLEPLETVHLSIQHSLFSWISSITFQSIPTDHEVDVAFRLSPALTQLLFWWTLNIFNSWLTVWNASAFKCRVICQRLLALVWCQPAVIRLRQFRNYVWLGKGVARLELKGWGKSQPNESDVLCRAPQKIIPEWRWWYTNTLSGISHYCDPNEPLITRQKPCHAKRYNRKRWARMGQNHGPNKSFGRFNSNCWKRYPLVHCYSLLWKITTLTAKSTISMAIFKFANSNSLPGRVDHSSRNIQLDLPEPYPETFHRKLPASPALGPWALDRTGSIWSWELCRFGSARMQRQWSDTPII